MRNEPLHPQGAGAVGRAAVGGEGLTPSSALQGTEEPPKFERERTTPPPAENCSVGLFFNVLSENFAGRVFKEEGTGFMESNM